MVARFLRAPVCLVLGFGVFVPGLAAAAEGTPPSAPTPSERSSSDGDAPTPPASTPATAPSRSWYGWQILGLDVASIALLVAAVPVAIQNTSAGVGVAVLGGLGYVGGGPIVHLGREHRGKAAASVALRLLVPAFVGGIGAGILESMYKTPPSNSDALDLGPGFSAAVGFVLGGAIGMVGASAVDVSALAWEPPAPPPSSGTPATRLSWRAVPTVYSISDGGRRSHPAFGVAGSF